MPVTIEINGDTMVARLSGELDHHHTQKLREEIDRNVQKERPARLALDFAGVEFMDSSGIGLVLGRYRLMQEMNGKLVLRAMPPHIRRVMRVAGIASLEIEEEKQNNQTTTSNFPCNFNFAVSNMNRFNQGIYHG